MLGNICKLILIPATLIVSATLESVGQDRYRVTLQSTGGTDPTHPAAPYREAYVYDYVDQPPHFPGGDAAMVSYINDQRRYPRDAYQARVEGRVVCSFVVTSSGDIENVGVVRGVEPSLDAEAVRVIERMPNWVAGRIDDTPVAVYCILTIPFRL